MARSSANVPCSLWGDPVFLSHSAEQKALYLCVFTQRNVDAAGILPLTVRRWSRMIGGGYTPTAALDDLDSLAGSHFVEVDHDTDEVFVSGYFASERIGSQPRRAAAAHNALADAYSRRIRAVAQAELAEEFRMAADRTPRGLRAVVLERDGYRCRGCGWHPGDEPTGNSGELLYRALEVDHIHPKSRGGTNTLSNLQSLCTLCNTLKGAKI